MVTQDKAWNYLWRMNRMTISRGDMSSVELHSRCYDKWLGQSSSYYVRLNGQVCFFVQRFAIAFKVLQSTTQQDGIHIIYVWTRMVNSQCSAKVMPSMDDWLLCINVHWAKQTAFWRAAFIFAFGSKEQQRRHVLINKISWGLREGLSWKDDSLLVSGGWRTCDHNRKQQTKMLWEST